MNQVTKGNWEVTSFYGFDQNTGRVYYQSTEDGNINRNVYSVLPNAKNKVRLTQQTGTNRADFSANFTYFINTFSDANTPFVYSLHEAKSGKSIREIKNNSALKSKLASYKISPKEFSTIKIHGEDLNMYMIKPLDFDENKTYPLFMYQYSGPGSQNVSNSWMGGNDYWHQMLAQQGYIVVCVDGRGTGFKGAKFKKMTQNELGKYEVEDQTAVAKKLGAQSYIYTERYMKTPQENASGYDNNSPITHVKNLKGKLLLVHGSADDNVHVQNTMSLVEALVQENKQFDWRIYPDKNHGIYGGNTRLHLYTLMTDYIKENL